MQSIQRYPDVFDGLVGSALVGTLVSHRELINC